MNLAMAQDEQDDRIAETIERERGRLRNFIRSRVADELDVEDVLQDVFSELVEAYRLAKPIEQAGAWLFRVARNRIVDLFRRRRLAPRMPDGRGPTTTGIRSGSRSCFPRRTRDRKRPTPERFSSKSSSSPWASSRPSSARSSSRTRSRVGVSENWPPKAASA